MTDYEKKERETNKNHKRNRGTVDCAKWKCWRLSSKDFLITSVHFLQITAINETGLQREAREEEYGDVVSSHQHGICRFNRRHWCAVFPYSSVSVWWSRVWCQIALLFIKFTGYLGFGGAWQECLICLYRSFTLSFSSVLFVLFVLSPGFNVGFILSSRKMFLSRLIFNVELFPKVNYRDLVSCIFYFEIKLRAFSTIKFIIINSILLKLMMYYDTNCFEYSYRKHEVIKKSVSTPLSIC